MRFLGILITLAIVAYAISVYLKSGAEIVSEQEGVTTTPEAAKQQAQQAVDQLNNSLQQQQEKFNNLQE